MRYKTQNDVIAAAQAHGSKSTIYKNSQKFLLTHPQSDNNNNYFPDKNLRDFNALIQYRSEQLIAGKRLIHIARSCVANALADAKPYIRSKYGHWVAHVGQTLGKKYYRSGYYPLEYSNPGVIAAPGKNGDVIITVYDYTGIVRNIIKIPGKLVPKITTDGLLSTDVYGIQIINNVIVRYNSASQKIGYAVKYDYGWEHGDTLAAVRAERNHKRKIAAEKLAAEKLSLRQQRAVRLITRLCHRLIISYDDARAVGYCAAGINDFCRANNLPNNQVEIRQIPTAADRYWESVRDYRAQKIAATITRAGRNAIV